MATRLLRLAPIVAFAVLPAVGILFLGWDWREVLVLYWLENVGLGLVIVVQILRGAADGQVHGHLGGRPIRGRAATVLAFFAGFGLFTLAHGLFVFAIVGGAFNGILGGGRTDGLTPVISALTAAPGTPGSLNWPSLLVVTLVGFALHMAAVLVRPASLRGSDPLIRSAFQRLYVLHGAILLGGLVIALLGLPAAVALVLVVIHATLDVVTSRETGATAPENEQHHARHLEPEEPDRGQ